MSIPNTPDAKHEAEFFRALLRESQTVELAQRLRQVTTERAGYKFAFQASLLALMCSIAGSLIILSDLPFYWLGLAVAGVLVWLAVAILCCIAPSLERLHDQAENESDEEGDTGVPPVHSHQD